MNPLDTIKQEAREEFKEKYFRLTPPTTPPMASYEDGWRDATLNILVGLDFDTLLTRTWNTALEVAERECVVSDEEMTLEQINNGFALRSEVITRFKKLRGV